MHELSLHDHFSGCENETKRRSQKVGIKSHRHNMKERSECKNNMLPSHAKHGRNETTHKEKEMLLILEQKTWDF